MACASLMIMVNAYYKRAGHHVSAQPHMPQCRLAPVSTSHSQLSVAARRDGRARACKLMSEELKLAIDQATVPKNRTALLGNDATRPLKVLQILGCRGL